MLKIIKFLARRLNILSYIYHKMNAIIPSFDSLNPANLTALKKSFKDAPQGDYYEFGIYKGFSFWFAMQIADILGRKDTHFYGFDSFEGLPVPKGVDLLPDRFGNAFAKGNFCAGLDFVKSTLNKYGAEQDKYTLIEGYFEDVLNVELLKKYRFKKASIILIDCDLYESTRTVLNFLPNLLQNGTIILFDDWELTEKDRGQQLAFREWHEKNQDFIFEEFMNFQGGNGFRIRVKKSVI